VSENKEKSVTQKDAKKNVSTARQNNVETEKRTKEDITTGAKRISRRMLDLSGKKKEPLKNKKNNFKPLLKKTDKVKTKTETKEEVKPIVNVKKEKKTKFSISNGSVYATGKRKNSIAKVYLKEGSGNISINGKNAKEYLMRDILFTIINQPFEATNLLGKYDVVCSVLGGGLSGQAGAIRHAISIALQSIDFNLRKNLKSLGFLTRDSRVVERKKAGLKKARKKEQFSKR